MKLYPALLALAPLSLLLTGCPLTDHYRLQEDSLAAGGADGGEFSAGGASTPAGGSGGESEVAGGEAAGGLNDHCSVTCNANRACVDNVCTGGWVLMATPPPQIAARSKAAVVAMGRSVFIWGGLNVDNMTLNNGGIYDPATDVWTPLPPDPGSPGARMLATAVWTGAASNKVIVFGGSDAVGGMIFKDGAVYDPIGNSWSALPGAPSVSKRSSAYGYWDGTRAVFYGGLISLNMNPQVVPGADRFDLAKWSTSPSSGDPGLLGFSATAFDGSVMYLQGGVIEGVRQDKVFAYTSSTNTWASLPKGPSPRTGGFGAWDGTHFVVWGGQDDAGMLADGKIMTGMSWSDMASSDVLSPRRIGSGRSGWAFQVKPGVVAMIGGQNSTSGSSDTLMTDGATYVAESGTWTAIPSWPSGEKHEYGMGVWTGEEFVIWGGRKQNVSSLTGERWAP
jgi:hypothetical protein